MAIVLLHCITRTYNLVISLDMNGLSYDDFIIYNFKFLNV